MECNGVSFLRKYSCNGPFIQAGEGKQGRTRVSLIFKATLSHSDHTPSGRGQWHLCQPPSGRGQHFPPTVMCILYVSVSICVYNFMRWPEEGIQSLGPGVTGCY